MSRVERDNWDRLVKLNCRKAPRSVGGLSAICGDSKKLRSHVSDLCSRKNILDGLVLKSWRKVDVGTVLFMLVHI